MTTNRREESRFRMRAALLRLRIIEDTAVKMLPPAEAIELAEAIQGVVNLIRTQEGATGEATRTQSGPSTSSGQKMPRSARGHFRGAVT